jgi:hypothetical protein
MDDGSVSPAEQSFCNRCGSQLWLFDSRWPEYLHSFASAFDTPLPKPPAFLDNFLSSRSPWTVLHEGGAIERLDGPYSVGMEDWHRQRGLWVELAPVAPALTRQTGALVHQTVNSFD